VHVDLLEIDVTKKIDVTVALNFVGKAVGVGEGGVLNFIERTIQIRCLPTAIPQHIDVDVSSLAIGNSLHSDDLKLPEGIEKASQLNSTLVTCVPPTKEEDAVASLAPTAEPEVITEKKPAEGEAAAAGADAKKEEKKK
jgi:large subunit ribosomal protein L25